MSNSFDFELVAGDHVSEAIAQIDEAVRNLEPQLEKTRQGLQLGGQETIDGLNGYNSRLDIMARTARDNVQFIGDMIPHENSGRTGRQVGWAGAGWWSYRYYRWCGICDR